MKKIVLITGATGYLGGRIAQKLSESDLFFLRLACTGRRGVPLQGLKNSEKKVFNLLGKDEFDELCKGATCIVHCAAMNAQECETEPARAVLVNTVGTLRLLEAARRQKVKKFIYFSTAHVYGSPLAGRITEGSPARPVHPYAITHRAAEDFVLSGYARNDLAGAVIRLSNAVGAPVDARVNCWALLANDLCRQAVTTNKLILKTAGLQGRDFIMIENIYRALVHIVSLPEDDIRGQIFNLGSGKSMRVIDLAGLIQKRCRKILGHNPEIITPHSPGSRALPRLDYRIDKLKATGFQPIDGLTAEIDGTLIFCQRNFGKKV